MRIQMVMIILSTFLGCADIQNQPQVATSQPSGQVNQSPIGQQGQVNTAFVRQGIDDWTVRILASGIVAAVIIPLFYYPVQRRWRLGKQKAQEILKG